MKNEEVIASYIKNQLIYVWRNAESLDLDTIKHTAKLTLENLKEFLKED